MFIKSFVLWGALTLSMHETPPPSGESEIPQGAENSATMTPAEFQALPSKTADFRLTYGTAPQQFGDLRVPRGRGPHPVVILIHGGCWKSEYSTLRDLAPMADALKDLGIATWNIEYRRLGNPGGGWPGTYQDVAAGVDYLRTIAPRNALDLDRVIVVGHSAGGHLAMWAAARRRLPSDSALYRSDPLLLRGIINLAGTTDMASFIPAEQQGCQDNVVEKMMGGTPANVPAHYAQTSALQMLPLGLSQVLVWGTADTVAPVALGQTYAEAAMRVGDPARLVTFQKVGHFEIASPRSSTWPTVAREIQQALSR